jgi:hypothetical protein
MAAAAASGMGAGGADPAAAGTSLPFLSLAGPLLVARAAKRGGQVSGGDDIHRVVPSVVGPGQELIRGTHTSTSVAG